jgi:hypothetical protein
VRPLRRDFRIRLIECLDQRVARTAAQLRAKGLELCRDAHGIDLHAPVTKVFYISGKSQLAGQSLGEVAIADALYPSGDVKPLGLLLFRHVMPRVAASRRDTRF